jgi:HAMP domain-containing protein
LELGTNLEEASQQIQAMDPDAKAPLTGLSTKLDELAREIERLEADRSE